MCGQTLLQSFPRDEPASGYRWKGITYLMQYLWYLRGIRKEVRHIRAVVIAENRIN